MHEFLGREGFIALRLRDQRETVFGFVGRPRCGFICLSKEPRLGPLPCPDASDRVGEKFVDRYVCCTAAKNSSALKKLGEARWDEMEVFCCVSLSCLDPLQRSCE